MKEKTLLYTLTGSLKRWAGAALKSPGGAALACLFALAVPISAVADGGGGTGWTLNSYSYSLQTNSTINYTTFPWSVQVSASGTISGSSGDNRLQVNGSGSATSNIELIETSPVNSGQNGDAYALAQGTATWHYNGKAGDSPSFNIITSASGSGSVSIDGLMRHSVYSILSLNGAIALGEGYASSGVTSDGTLRLGTNGFSSSGASTTSASYSFQNIDNGLGTSIGWQYSGSANYTIYVSSNYYTTAGISSITANVRVKCEAISNLLADDPYRSWGHADASANISGSAYVKLDY